MVARSDLPVPWGTARPSDPVPSFAPRTVQGEVMHKFGALLAALGAIVIIAPTALAFDCDTDDVADCVRSILKVSPVRQVVPSIPRPSAVLKGECDADDEDDIKVCLRGLKAPGVGRLSEPDARPVAAPAEGKPPEKLSEAAQASATVASKHTPGFAASPRSAKLVVPLPERALLQPQSEPGCELKASQEEGGEPSIRSGGQLPAPPPESYRKLGQVDSNAALGLRMRLEYERDCFRRAEIQARDRLHQLQAAVGETIKSVKRIERNGF